MTYSNSGYSGIALRLVFSLHFYYIYCYKGLVYTARLLLISCHDNKLFSFSEFRGMVVVIVTNPMFILPWVQELNYHVKVV